jgi:hypothetical protein
MAYTLQQSKHSNGKSSIKHSIYSGFPVDFQLPCLMTPEGKEVMDSKPKNDLPWPGEE